MVAADFDRDGDPDLVIRNLQTQSLQIMRNDLNTAHGSLIVQLEQAGHNPQAIGAVVQLDCGGKKQYRQVTAGHSFLAQSPYEVHFGLGNCSAKSTVSVKWPDGHQTKHDNIDANQWMNIHRDKGPTFTALQRSVPLENTLVNGASKMRFKRPKGKDISLVAEGDKRQVVVNIWAPWCVACKKEIPALQAWAKENAETHRVLYMSFQMDELDVVSSTAKKLGIDTVVGTPEFFERYLPESSVEIPVTLLLNHDGSPVKQFFGANYDWQNFGK